MRMLEPVVWSKGVFLTPQHLQAQDRFIESLLEYRIDTLRFRPWGFTELVLDGEAMSNGLLKINRAAGIFPDGLLFDIPDSDAAPEPKPLAAHFSADQETLDTFLAVPAFRDRGMNVSAPGRGLDTRYVAEVATVRDENTGASERPIQVARKNFRLLTAEENRQGNCLLPLARVRRSADVFEAEPRFVPPLLDLAANSYLVSIARRLVEILSAKSGMLAGMRRQKNQSLAEFTVADIANFWLLYTVNSHFPLFRHLSGSRGHHPEELFAAMSSLASALTTFSLKIQPRDLPSYDHDDLGTCFTALDETLEYLLDTVVPSNFVSLQLKLIRPSVFATSLADDRYLTGTKMYLAIRAEVGEADLIQKIPQLIKVCSATHVEHLIRQALPGVTLTHSVSPPSTIPVKLNYQYFSLSQSGLAWEAIGRARNLAAYVPGDFPGAQLELIILLPEAA
jgi:type VI secretion system protein ImpJ